MQDLLTQLIQLIAIAFVGLMILDLVAQLYTRYESMNTPETIMQPATEDSTPETITPSEEETQVLATLEWLLQSIAEEPATLEEETPDIIQLAKARTTSKPPVIDSVIEVAREITTHLTDLSGLGIRELKKLASERKLKGYGKMTKAQLLQALA